MSVEHKLNDTDRGHGCVTVPRCPPQIGHGLNLYYNCRLASNRLSHGKDSMRYYEYSDET